jgi:hypothetical protein
MTNRFSVAHLAAGLLTVVLLSPSVVTANGLAFFKPADGGVVDLVYFGQVKDPDGQLLTSVELAVETSSRYMYEIQFDQDRPGHYRSPDVGALYKEALQKVDPSLITITARKYGYKTVTRKVPMRTSGVQRVDFTMEREDSQTTSVAVPAGGGRVDALFMSVGMIAVLLIAAAARRASRQPSTIG